MTGEEDIIMKNRKMIGLTILIWISIVIVSVLIVKLIRPSVYTKQHNSMSSTETTEQGNTEVRNTEKHITEEPDTENATIETIRNDGPDSLFDCWTTVNDWEDYCSIEFNTMDNMGDVHSKSYIIDDYDITEYQSSITVKLDKKYSRLEIPSIYLMAESKDSDTEYVLMFYDQDGHELGASPLITKGVKPDSFEIDVSGVEFLEIKKKIESYGPWHDCYIGLDGAYLYE